MLLDIGQDDLRNGVLGLVVALVEIIKETLQLQAVRRMEGGSLSEEQVERLGDALLELDQVIQGIKLELGIARAVQEVRSGLDRIAGDLLNTVLTSSCPDGQELRYGAA